MINALQYALLEIHLCAKDAIRYSLKWKMICIYIWNGMFDYGNWEYNTFLHSQLPTGRWQKSYFKKRYNLDLKIYLIASTHHVLNKKHSFPWDQWQYRITMTNITTTITHNRQYNVYICIVYHHIWCYYSLVPHYPHPRSIEQINEYINTKLIMSCSDDTMMTWCVWEFMMTSSNGNIFPRHWPFVQGIHQSPVNSPHKGQWRVALMFSLTRVWINGWVNNREAGD